MVLNDKWEKLVVFDEHGEKEIAVVTQDGVTTADDSIVVRLTPAPN